MKAQIQFHMDFLAALISDNKIIYCHSTTGYNKSFAKWHCESHSLNIYLQIMILEILILFVSIAATSQNPERY